MFKKSISEEEINELIDARLEETIKNQAEEISELRKMIKHQSCEIYELRKKVNEGTASGGSVTVTEEGLKEISKKISQELLAEPEEETLKRAKPFCDENGEMNSPLSRMGYVMSECTNFTQKYISKMLTHLFSEKK